MKNETRLYLNLIFAILLLFTSSTLFINIKFEKPKLNPQDSFLNFDSSFLRIISFGHKKFIANVFWIKTLLDSDLDHYEGDDLKSWMFLRFNTISNLDPYFRENYVFAVQYLSIVKDDLKGAIKIAEKGLKYYPNNYTLNYQIGFVYAFELKNYEKAIPYFEKAVNSPQAPIFLKSLILKMKSEVGISLKEIYLELLQQYKETYQYGPEKNKTEIELNSLKTQIDLKCLNDKANSNCEKKDFFGNPYLVDENGKYSSRVLINKYEINKK